jgi:hypothetical protein
MRTLAKFSSVWLMIAVLLAPLPTFGQTQTYAPTTPPPATPPPADLYQEGLKASQPEDKPNQGAYEAGAVVVSLFLAPGRAILCGLGTGAAAVVLFVSFGTGYGTAKRIFEEGCVGPYIVTGDDLRRENERRGIAPDAYLK